MGSSCISKRIHLLSLALSILLSEFQGCFSLNPEGLALLEFRAKVDSDPHGAFTNWNPQDLHPCSWSGVHCLDGQVRMLDLHGLSLKGALAPELGNLTHLTSLVLSKNEFFGVIPKPLGQLAMLEVLDLSDNNLTGIIPAEIGKLQSLKHLVLCNNSFEEGTPTEIGKLEYLTESQFQTQIVCLNRKFGHCIFLQSNEKPLRVKSVFSFLNRGLTHYLDFFPMLRFGERFLNYNGDEFCDNLSCSTEPHLAQRRRLAEETSNNLAAPTFNGVDDHFLALPSSRSSGSFPAVPGRKNPILSPAPGSSNGPSSLGIFGYDGPASGAEDDDWDWDWDWDYIAAVFIGGFFIIFVVLIMICRSRAVKSIRRPWKTGLSGQLQKAFVTGVPKLNPIELETACENYSNIVTEHEPVTVFKGTLSSGVEIAVASTTLTSKKDWPRSSELGYRKKIDTLSRVNHKNFNNLIGYCEEDEPFVRMMVFEYAPNGTLSEHLHVEEMEHLDWHARMRVIMGISYCLQYMHELNPPVAHSNLNSDSIYLTDDYAAKISEVGFWREFLRNAKKLDENDPDNSALPPLVDAETNVYSFGILLLEIISGKLPNSKEEGPILDWAEQYLSDKGMMSKLVDPTLKSIKNRELDVICEVIQECVEPDARKRPTMREITSLLRDVIDISPEAATPRMSPLWWAELEILSEAS